MLEFLFVYLIPIVCFVLVIATCVMYISLKTKFEDFLKHYWEYRDIEENLFWRYNEVHDLFYDWIKTTFSRLDDLIEWRDIINDCVFELWVKNWFIDDEMVDNVEKKLEEDGKEFEDSLELLINVKPTDSNYVNKEINKSKRGRKPRK